MSLEEKPAPSPSPVRPPWWVRTLLWGSSGRGDMWVNVWVSLALAVGSFIGGFWYPPAFVGAILVWSALGYWAAIRWVDRNGGWPDKN